MVGIFRLALVMAVFGAFEFCHLHLESLFKTEVLSDLFVCEIFGDLFEECLLSREEGLALFQLDVVSLYFLLVGHLAVAVALAAVVCGNAGFFLSGLFIFVGLLFGSFIFVVGFPESVFLVVVQFEVLFEEFFFEHSNGIRSQQFGLMALMRALCVIFATLMGFFVFLCGCGVPGEQHSAKAE